MAVTRTVLVLALSFLFIAAAFAQPPAPAPDAIAFIHANVIPMDRERVLRDQTVIVSQGRIAKIGKTSSIKVPDSALKIDAGGRYLLPALCDMHVHIEGEAWNAALRPEERTAITDARYESFLFPYVANGVTTVQVLSGTADEIPLRQRIARNEFLGPRLILARMIDGPKKAWPPPISVWVDSPQEAREAVRRAKAEGYDMMKVYSFLSPESYDAIIETAKELNMPVIGHIPMSVSVEHVIESGQKMIAHTEELAKHTEGNYSQERIDHYAALMAKNGVYLEPTLFTTRTIIELFDDPERVMGRPEAAYHADVMQRGIWSFISERLYKPVPEAARKKIRDDYDKFQRPLTKSFRAKGGRMLAGSDVILPGLVAGFALHGELRELVDVGLTPYEALRTSTTIPFEYLGEKDKGTIAAGSQSDLILVDRNPLEDISAAASVSGVLMRGRWIAKEEIDKKMREIAAPRKVASN